MLFRLLRDSALWVLPSLLLKPGMGADDLQTAITDIQELMRDIGSADDDIARPGVHALVNSASLWRTAQVSV